MSHGTRAAYVKGCKCKPCRAANAKYAKFQRYMRQTGQGILIDAGPVKAHVAMLRAAGIGRRTIAKRSGVSQTVIDRLAGVNTEKACNRVRRETHQRIMAVRPDDVASGAFIPAVGTARRLRALVALGWPQTELARRMGWSGNNLSTLMHARTSVTGGTARIVRGLYDDLSMTPGPSKRARTIAAKYGWLPPLAWDDDLIDDAAFEPQGVVRRDRAGQSGITIEDIQDAWAQGYSTAEQVGWRLGVPRHVVDQQLSRASRAS